MDSGKNPHKKTLEDDDEEENRRVNDEKSTRDEEEDDARLIIHTPPEININLEELRAAEVNVIPRQRNYDPVLQGIVDSRFEALYKREFTTDLTAEVRGYIQEVREHMEAVRAEMVSLRQENRILTGVTKAKHLVGNDPWINQLLITLIVNRERISRLESENDTIAHENSAYREELSRIRREGCIRKDILNLDDRPSYREWSPSELEEAGVTMTRVRPLPSYSLAPDEAPPLKNRHMVPGNYIDTYEALGLPLPIGKLTHMVQFKPNVLGHTVDIKKIKSESAIVSDDVDDSSEEDGEEEEEEGIPAVSPGMNPRLAAKQAKEQKSFSNADMPKGNKMSEMPKVEKKPQQRSLSYQRPVDICKVKSDIEARLSSNTPPKTIKASGKNINGVMLPPITSAAAEETGATEKAARRKHRTPREDNVDKRVKPPEKLVAMGLDCIKPSSRLVYLGSLPINTANSNVQPEKVKEADKLPTVSAKTSEKLEPPKDPTQSPREKSKISRPRALASASVKGRARLNHPPPRSEIPLPKKKLNMLPSISEMTNELNSRLTSGDLPSTSEVPEASVLPIIVKKASDTPDRQGRATRLDKIKMPSILPNRLLMKSPIKNKKRVTPDGSDGRRRRPGTAISKSLGCIKERTSDDEENEPKSPI